MIRFLIFFLSFWVAFACSVTHGQQLIRVTGIVVDSITNMQVESVTIRTDVSTIITSTNEKGHFEFDLEVPLIIQIKASCVGYKSKTIKVDPGDFHTIVIKLSPSVTELNEVIVKAPKSSEQAKNILFSAINQLKKKSKPFASMADFHHSIKENGKFVKLIDGELKIIERKGFNMNLRPEILQEDINYVNKRESLDFSSNRVVFQRSYFDFYYNDFAFLLKNGLKYTVSTREYDYYIKSVTKEVDAIIYEISAFDKTNTQSGDYYEIFDVTYSIRIENEKHDYFLQSYELNYQNNLKGNHLNHSESGFFRIEMNRSENETFPKYIEHYLIQKTRFDSESENKQIEALHQIKFKDLREKTKSEGDKNVVYSPEFWKNRNIARDITKDLSSKIALEKQFNTQHLFSERQKMQESISKGILDNVLRENKEKVVYLIIWNDPEALRPILGSTKNIDPERIQLVFVGSINSHKEWSFIISGTEFMYYPQFNLRNLYRDYLQKDQSLPKYILLRPGMEPIYKRSPIDIDQI